MNLKENRARNFVSMNMFSEATHDQFELPRSFDEQFNSMLRDFHSKGYLDNMLLIVFGDHGARPFTFGKEQYNDFAYQEFPFPYLSISLPSSLMNTQFHRNFLNNKHKLLTAYDIHKTLKQLFYLAKYGADEDNFKCRHLFKESNYKKASLRGVSLLEEIPMQRSCSDALIPLKFCPCTSLSEIDSRKFTAETDIAIDAVTSYFVNEVNKKTQDVRDQCLELKFDRLNSIKKIKIQRKNSRDVYEFTLTLSPGQAIYKFVINLLRNGKFDIRGDISREDKIDKYCLSNKNLREFCYCNV